MRSLRSRKIASATCISNAVCQAISQSETLRRWKASYLKILQLSVFLSSPASANCSNKTLEARLLLKNNKLSYTFISFSSKAVFINFFLNKISTSIDFCFPPSVSFRLSFQFRCLSVLKSSSLPESTCVCPKKLWKPNDFSVKENCSLFFRVSLKARAETSQTVTAWMDLKKLV